MEAEAGETIRPMTSTVENLPPPRGVSEEEFQGIKSSVIQFHIYKSKPGQCSSLLAQRISAPAESVSGIIQRFDKPNAYKDFIKSCAVRYDFSLKIGDLRDVTVVSGVPAETSTERLDLIDDDNRVTGFSIIGGEHPLRNCMTKYTNES